MAIECAFCSKPAVTKGGEHAFSDWMNPVVEEMFPRTQKTIAMVTDKGKTAQWKQKSLDMKLPVVCAKCNNGWMSQLEQQHAKPAMRGLIISDKLASVPPDQLQSIAIFAFKQAVVADYASVPSRTPFFSSTERHSFAATLAIPQGVHMWLAAFKEKSQGFFLPLYYEYPNAANANRGFQLYSFTFGVGYFCFQFIGLRWINPAMAGFPGLLSQDRSWDKFTLPFWPSDGQAVRWPPSKQMTLDTAHRFIYRWNEMVIK